MPIDLELAVGAELPPVCFEWSESDVLLYHLALGAGRANTDDAQLRYVTEGRVAALPSFATVAATFNASDPPRVSFPGVDIDLGAVVHGAQSVTVHGPIPSSGKASTVTRISEIMDKGSAAVIVQESTTTAPDGAPLWTARSSIFAKGEGGFGGTRGTSASKWTPDRDPDHTVEIATLPQQALLYRLCGDRNPLHSDPKFAVAAGFEAPILHGLCTYGMTCKAVADAFGAADPRTVSTFSATFSGIFFPGETLRIRLWRNAETVRGLVTCVERDDAPVLSGVSATLMR
ncbi:MAG: MaoC/PaaZ C-terminal domain-containing protein [Rhodococcus sp. (in: high G+C Gram-positive bacteria)]